MGLAVVVCAALFTAPSWYQTLVEHSATMKTTVERFVVALPVAWALLLMVATAMRPHPQRAAETENETADASRVVQARTTIENNPEP